MIDLFVGGCGCFFFSHCLFVWLCVWVCLGLYVLVRFDRFPPGRKRKFYLNEIMWPGIPAGMIFNRNSQLGFIFIGAGHYAGYRVSSPYTSPDCFSISSLWIRFSSQECAKKGTDGRFLSIFHILNYPRTGSNSGRNIQKWWAKILLDDKQSYWKMNSRKVWRRREKQYIVITSLNIYIQ